MHLVWVYGAEYEQPLVSECHQHNAPCAVCNLPSYMSYSGCMIPCSYECVDLSMESIPGSENYINGGHFYHVEAHCNGMACQRTHLCCVQQIMMKL